MSEEELERTERQRMRNSVSSPVARDALIEPLGASISRGIDFLYRNQLPDGEFPSYRIATKEGAGYWKPDSSIFPTALIAHSLKFFQGEKAYEMRRKAKSFLLQEMRPPGVWAYWSSKSGLAIPPDLDDTCCASAVLVEDRPDLLKDNVSIILNSRNSKGLFYTFIKPEKDRDNDIDSVVNANVLFYLKEFEGIERVVDALHEVMTENREDRSYWYYLTPAALYYMVARARANGAKRLEVCSDIIVAKIRTNRLQSGASGNETETALDVCSFLYLGKKDLPMIRPAVEYLIDCQQEDGSWPRQRFYAGPPPPLPRSVWFGSEALTTMISLEALARALDCFRKVS